MQIAQIIGNRKIVYWGTGAMCEVYLNRYPSIRPPFLIDSYSQNKMLYGRPVKQPHEIEDWSLYYIVIMARTDRITNEISNILEEKGLERGKDFCSHRDIFIRDVPAIDKSIGQICSYMNGRKEAANPIMLMMPVENVRGTGVFLSFLSRYIKAREPQKCIMYSHLGILSDEEASALLGCPVFCLPQFKGDDTVIAGTLSEQEWDWIRELEKRKIAYDREKEIKISGEMYGYYKAIMEVMKPSKLIVWGNWNRDTYILGHLADTYGIPYGYMEHGWIPGTYQVDPRGIMGQGEYAVNFRMFEHLTVPPVYDIGRIKKFVLEQKLDTRIFVETEEDNAALQKVDRNKKTMFFVGMDDHNMQMNPASGYWKKYISDVVQSTEQALFLLADVCRKNGWNFIFKPHPSNPVPDLKGCSNDIVLVHETEIDRLIKMADVVVSIASAVDYKTLMYGKPLVQLGINGLKGKGCSYEVSEAAALEEQMISALKNGMTDRQKDNFDRLLQILLQRYLWDDMSDRSLRYGLSVERDFING